MLRALDKVIKSLGESPFYERVEGQLSAYYGGAVSTSVTDKAEKYQEARKEGETHEETAHHLKGLAKSARQSRVFGDLDEGIFA